MINQQKVCFMDCFDTILMVSKEARENLGEDSFFCAGQNRSAIVSVYDGSGGLGAHKYDSFKGHTGAYMASRTVSCAVCDWYKDHHNKSWKNIYKMVESIDSYIRKAYKICEFYNTDKMRIKGSMVRKFPTTMALAYAENDTDGILLNVIWAGDSRVYLLDENGLAQVTKDDSDVEDALENLSNDGVMFNVLSSDGKYQLNYKTIKLIKPTIVFAATDGCFSYMHSPMEFEYVILKTLCNSKTPYLFQKELQITLSKYAGDDLTLGLMSFYYEDFKKVKISLSERLVYMKKKYIDILNREKSHECLHHLWKEYKCFYERYL